MTCVVQQGRQILQNIDISDRMKFIITLGEFMFKLHYLCIHITLFCPFSVVMNFTVRISLSFLLLIVSTGCMDDIITVLAEEHGCLDTVKVSLLILMDRLSSLYFTFHTKIDLNLTVFFLNLLLQDRKVHNQCHSKMWFISVASFQRDLTLKGLL